MSPTVRILRAAALLVAAAAVGALVAVVALRDTSDRTQPSGSATVTSTQAPTVSTTPSGQPGSTSPGTSTTSPSSTSSSTSSTSASSSTSTSPATTPSGSSSDGPLVTEQRSLAPFDGIVLASAATVIVHISPSLPAAVTVTGEKAVVPRLLTEVRDGVLTISADRSYDSRSRLVVDVTTRSLTAAELRGSGEISVSALDASTFRALLSGSGTITLDGRVDDLSARIGGSGSVQAAGVRARTVSADIGGSGDIDVTASEALDARIAGAGAVRYAGSPRVTTTMTGAGSVTKR